MVLSDVQGFLIYNTISISVGVFVYSEWLANLRGIHNDTVLALSLLKETSTIPFSRSTRPREIQNTIKFQAYCFTASRTVSLDT